MVMHRRCGFWGNDAYTKLLLHFDGADEAQASHDSSRSGLVLTFVAGAKLDDAQKGFGLTSLYLDGADDSVTIPYTTQFAFGALPFTIDGIFRITTSAASRCLFEATPDGISQIVAYTDASANLFFRGKVGADTLALYNTATWTPTVDTNYHIAFVRNGTSFYIFVDGVAQDLTTTTAVASSDIGNSNGTLYLGITNAGVLDNKGWTDEFRVSHTARWTANFTPPTIAYR